jgi:hypothetical protein
VVLDRKPGEKHEAGCHEYETGSQYQSDDPFPAGPNERQSETAQRHGDDEVKYEGDSRVRVQEATERDTGHRGDDMSGRYVLRTSTSLRRPTSQASYSSPVQPSPAVSSA